METLIPHEWFTDLAQWLLLLICIGALSLLISGANWLVGGIAGIAYRLRISKAVVAATVLSLGTTSPETAVSVTAAWSGQPGLALGNAVGSFICNAALIFGLGSTIAALPADRFVLLRQGAWQLGVAVLLAVLCYLSYLVNPHDPALERWAGMLMLLLLIGYIIMSIRWGRMHPHAEPFMPAEDIAAPPETQQKSMTAFAAASLVGLLAVLLASHIFVGGITVLSEVHWRIPKVIVAATIVSLGTSLPELVISLTSVYKGHGEVLVGNVIGANVLNILWVAGASATAARLPLLVLNEEAQRPRIFLWLHLPALLFAVALLSFFLALASRRGRFARGLGWPMLLIYLAYVSSQLLLGT